MEETIEVTYSVFGFDEAGETTFDMDVSEKNYNRLQDAEDDGELLDQDYISIEMRGLHNKIIREIHNTRMKVLTLITALILATTAIAQENLQKGAGI